jgi:hypothetical protein
LVEQTTLDVVVTAVESAYADAGFGTPSAFVATACDGARRL